MGEMIGFVLVNFLFFFLHFFSPEIGINQARADGEAFFTLSYLVWVDWEWVYGRFHYFRGIRAYYLSWHRDILFALPFTLLFLVFFSEHHCFLHSLTSISGFLIRDVRFLSFLVLSIPFVCFISDDCMHGGC